MTGTFHWTAILHKETLKEPLNVCRFASSPRISRFLLTD